MSCFLNEGRGGRGGGGGGGGQVKAEGGLCFMSEEDRGIGGLKGPLFCELGRVGGGGGGASLRCVLVMEVCDRGSLSSVQLEEGTMGLHCTV